ncbi:hypothetical protein, partial [Citrobacter freundii]|uniref:hypothetical protein n=1 Tax=Citrobacter freundii TaxID=546 RepID=UPI00195342A7
LVHEHGIPIEEGATHFPGAHSPRERLAIAQSPRPVRVLSWQCQSGVKPAFGRARSLLAMRLPTLPHPKTFAPIAINHSLSGSVHR